MSDLHLREYGEHNEELIQTVQELDPDLILLGGDLVTFPNPEYENMLSLCRSLADVAPLYGVLGNHESEMIYGGVDDQLAGKNFSEAGVQLLRNETRTIQIGGKQRGADRAGRCPVRTFYKYGASDCVESLSRQYDTFRICINHVPMAFVDYMQDAPFDLALAGHTHGGLIRLPCWGGCTPQRRGCSQSMRAACTSWTAGHPSSWAAAWATPTRAFPAYTIRRSWFWWM